MSTDTSIEPSDESQPVDGQTGAESSKQPSTGNTAREAQLSWAQKGLLVVAVLAGLVTGLLGLMAVLLAGSGVSNVAASVGLTLSSLIYGLLGYLVGVRDDFVRDEPLASDYGVAAAFGHFGMVLSIVLMVPGEFKHGALFAVAFLPMGVIYAGAWFGDQMRKKPEDSGQDEPPAEQVAP